MQSRDPRRDVRTYSYSDVKGFCSHRSAFVVIHSSTFHTPSQKASHVHQSSLRVRQDQLSRKFHAWNSIGIWERHLEGRYLPFQVLILALLMPCYPCRMKFKIMPRSHEVPTTQHCPQKLTTSSMDEDANSTSEESEDEEGLLIIQNFSQKSPKRKCSVQENGGNDTTGEFYYA